MKSRLGLGILFVCNILEAGQHLEHNLIKAVGEADMVTVRKLVEKIDRASLNAHEKREILELAQASCHDVLSATQKVSLAFCVDDLLSAVCGRLVSVWGASQVVYYALHLHTLPRVDDRVGKALGTGLSSLRCLGLLCAGLPKQSQQRRHESAQKIDECIAHCIQEVVAPTKILFE